MFKNLIVGLILASLILSFVCVIQPVAAFQSGPGRARYTVTLVVNESATPPTSAQSNNASVTAVALANPVIYLTPPTLTVEPGTTFSMNITLDDLSPDQGAAGLQFRLSWNASVLECLSREEVMFHTATPQPEWGNIWKIRDAVNNTAGYFDYVYTWVDVSQAIAQGYAPISGNTSVATLTFRSLAEGQTTLLLTSVKCGDINADTISLDQVDGNVIVRAPPSVAISPGSAVMDVGQSQLFTSAVSGGTSPYSYQWYLNGVPVSGATNPTWTLTPLSSGSYNVYLNVTDNVGYEVKSNITSVTVNTVPSVSISPPSWVMDVIQSRLFTSSVTGGTSPYTYQWYLDNAPVSGATSPTWTFVPSSSGSYNVYLNVTDNVGCRVKSNLVLVTVNPTPSVSISPTSPIIDFGQSQLFTSGVTNGTPPYMYQWVLNDAPVSGATNPTWTFTPGSSGSHSVYLNVTDNVGSIAKSNIALATVNPPPSVSISPNSVVMNVTQSQLFTSVVSDGTSPYYYQWYQNGSIVPDATSATWTFVPSVAGSYNVYVKVTDNVGVQATSNTANITVKELLVHDIAVTNVKTSKDGCKPMPTVGNDSFVKVNVTIFNGGDFAETFNVTLYANSTVVGTQTVSGLAAGAQTVLIYTWNVTGWALGNYTISAYATPVPGEVNIANNTYTDGIVKVVIPGDIKGDGVVDIYDAILLAAAYNSVPGQPNWSPNADLKTDGIIDIYDAIVLSNHFNEHE